MLYCQSIVLEVKMISTLLAASAGLILGIRITLMALMLICAVCIIVLHGEEDGLGAISGQTETQDSFYGKNKSKRKESTHKQWTMISGIV